MQDTNTDFSRNFYLFVLKGEQMRVLHVISDENIGGAGILLTNLLSLFDPRVIESTVALPQNSQLQERLAELGVRTLPLEHIASRPSFSSICEICKYVKKNPVDLIHANAAISARIAARLCGVPVVHTRHCCYAPSFLWKIPPIKQIGGFLNRWLSDRVIATADAAALNLQALGIPKRKISVIINGSHPIRPVFEEELESIRTSLHIEQSDFIVGICARLEKCKGHTTFLRAAKLVLDRCSMRRVRFLIIGDGSLRQQLEELCRELGIQSDVRFVGFVSDVAPYYRLMNINVNCSCGTETSSLALSEGMSAGIPTIASAYGGNASMIGDGRAGFLFPVGNERMLSEYICRIASDANLESSMRREALNRYNIYYTAERMTDEVIGVYRELVK